MGTLSKVENPLKHYCESCKKGIEAARQLVNKHVERKECFVWYAAANSWKPIYGTGCAHWVAHQLGIKNGGSSEKCLHGYTYRVRTLIQGRKIIDVKDIQVNDIYVTPHVDHTGMVIKIIPENVALKQKRTIIIRHDSSGQGRVVDNEFDTYFKGSGTFYR